MVVKRKSIKLMAEYIDKSFVIYVLNHFGSMQTWSIKDIISECKRKIESEKAADLGHEVIQNRHGDITHWMPLPEPPKEGHHEY